MNILLKNQDKVSWIGSNEIYMNELRKEFDLTNESPIRSGNLFNIRSWIL